MASQAASTASQRNKYTSPSPPPSSMTPPPSSQATRLSPPLLLKHQHTPSPTQLTSPPLTAKKITRYIDFNNTPGMYSPSQIANATLEDLRSTITEVIAECSSARASAAHHRLQYNLLTLESSEAMNRMQVEMAMSQKDLQVLHANSQLQPPVISTSFRTLSPESQLILDLRNTCQILELENNSLRHRLRDAKAVLVEREVTLCQENEWLKERIKQNRSHLKLVFPLEGHGPASSPTKSAIATPFVTPTRTRTTTRDARGGGGDHFSALLLADQVLTRNQEAASSAPSTPLFRNARAQRVPLPTAPPFTPHTPVRAYGPYYMHPGQPQLQKARDEEDTSPIRHHHGRRRESRDSTISASDVEGKRDAVRGEERRRVREPVTPTPQRRVAGAGALKGVKRKLFNDAGTDGGVSTSGRGGGVGHRKRPKLTVSQNQGIGLGIKGVRVSPGRR